MKRTLSTLTLLITFINSFGGNNIVLKPNFGIGITQFSENYESLKSQATLGTEFGLDLLVGRRVYLQSGIRYIRDSYRVNGEINNVNDFKTKIHNIGIKVPIHLGVYLIDMDATNLIKARIFTGPSFKATTTVNNEGDDFLKEDKYTDVTMGYQVGIGIDIWKIFIDAGYELGLNEMIKNTEIKSNGAYITAGFNIRIK